MNKSAQQQQQPLRMQQLGGAFQVENISDPSVKKTLYGWLSAKELGPETQFRFSNQLDSKKLGILRGAQLMLAKRPGNARSGYLCFYPPLKVAIFVEDSDRRPNQEVIKPPRTFILRMRHSPAIYSNGGSVFAATLNVSDSTLWIEDILVMEGANLWLNQSFSKRWSTLKSWFENDWSQDANLQRGLIIKPRQPQPLSSFVTEPGDVWEFIPEDAGRRRLMWKDKRLQNVKISSYPQKEQQRSQRQHQDSSGSSGSGSSGSGSSGNRQNNYNSHTHNNRTAQQNTVEAAPLVQVGILDTYFPSLPQENDGSLIAVAKKESGPDVYSLYTAESKPLGLAVIRKMVLSLAMRQHCQGEPIRVRVEWCSAFDRWEILDVNVKRNASPEAAFSNKINA